MQQGSSAAGTARRYTYMVPPVPGTIGEALRQDRLARNLDQVEVAQAAGFHQSKLSAYELGKIKHPPPERLVALARVYGRPDNYYTDIGGWPSGAELVRWREELAGSLVVPRPRDGLQDLLDTLGELDDAAFQRVAKLAEDERTWQRDRSGEAAVPAATRDTA